jgi:Ca-activated chloride channel family protein
VVAAALWATIAPGSAAAPQPAVFRGGIDVVRFGVTVMDRKGGLVTGLTRDDFEILEDGRPQTVEYVAAGDATADDGLPLHLGLLLDVSGSMAETIGFTRTASIRFVTQLADAEDVTVVDFDTEVRVARFGPRDPRLVERIREQRVRGWTALYDAIGVYLNGAADQEGRKIMLLYTDGGDTRSALSLGELLELLRASDVTLYAIGSTDRRATMGRMQLQGALRQMAETTGGEAFFPAGLDELDKVYERVIAGIRAQYVIGYSSTNPKSDGKWRNVEIRLRAPHSQDRRLRARKGYYAPFRP